MSILIGNTFLNNTGINIFQQTESYKDYDLYIDFTKSLKDQGSKTPLPAANYDTEHSNIVNGELVEYGTDEYVRDDDGRVLTCGGYTCCVPYSSKYDEWTLSDNVTISESTIDPPFVGLEYSQVKYNISATTSRILSTAYGYGTFTAGDSISGVFWVYPIVDTSIYVRFRGNNGYEANAVHNVTAGSWQKITNSAVLAASHIAIKFELYDVSGDTGDRFHITGFNLWQSPYELPYLENNTGSVLTVSATYADDNAGDEYGPRLAFEDIPGAVNALDGVADGENEVVSEPTYIIYTGSGQNLDKTFEVSGSPAIGDYFEFDLSVSNYSLGGLEIGVGSYAIVQVLLSGAGDYIFRLPATDTGDLIRFRSGGTSSYRLDINSVKQISPAQGEIEWKGRFGFDYDQAGTGDHALLSCNLTNDPVIWVDNTGTVSASDGTNTVTADIDYQADTDYTIILKYDGYNSLMKLNVNGTDYTAGTFDGSFDPDLDDHLYLGYQNDELIKCESLKFRKEVSW